MPNRPILTPEQRAANRKRSSARWREANRERIREDARRYHEENREARLEKRRALYARRKGAPVRAYAYVAPVASE